MKLDENTYNDYIRYKYKKKCNPYEILLFINIKSDLWHSHSVAPDRN